MKGIVLVGFFIAWTASLSILAYRSNHAKSKEIVHVIHAAPILENKTNYVTVTNVVTEAKFSTKGCTFFLGPKRYYMIDSHGKEHDL